jgi:hypothetical protein
VFSNVTCIAPAAAPAAALADISGSTSAALWLRSENVAWSSALSGLTSSVLQAPHRLMHRVSRRTRRSRRSATNTEWATSALRCATVANEAGSCSVWSTADADADEPSATSASGGALVCASRRGRCSTENGGSERAPTDDARALRATEAPRT